MRPSSLYRLSWTDSTRCGAESRLDRAGRVFLHPGSLLFEENKFASPFITFFNKQVTTKPFLRDANEVRPRVSRSLTLSCS